MIFRRLLLLLLLGWAENLLAQIPTDAIRKSIIPTFALKLVPLSAFDINPTYQLAGEIFLKNRRTSIQPEIGYGTYDSTPQTFDINNLKGQEVWRGRLELRKYHQPYTTTKREYSYHGFDLFFKQVLTPHNTDVGRDCDNGNCAYFEKINYTDGKQVYGLNYKIGYQWINKDRIVFDLYGGIGFRMIRIYKKNYPIDSSERMQFFNFTRTPGIYSGLTLLLGIRMGYLFVKPSK